MGSIAGYWSVEGLLLTAALCNTLRMSHYSTLMLTLMCLTSLCEAGSTPTHQLTKRAATVNPDIDPMYRTLDSSSLGIFGTVAVIVLVLVVLDIVGTLLLASAVGGRSMSDSLLSWDWDRSTVSRVYNSIDWVEAGLSLAGVKDESCRTKTICEWEQAAYSNSILRLGIHTINSGLPGLDKYSGAVSAGLKGEDCNLVYSQCQDTQQQQQQHTVTNHL